MPAPADGMDAGTASQLIPGVRPTIRGSGPLAVACLCAVRIGTPPRLNENACLHDVSFDEASTVFGDPFAATIPDPDHSIDEYRWITIGQTASGRLVVVIHAERAEVVRIISARPATKGQTTKYVEGKKADR